LVSADKVAFAAPLKKLIGAIRNTVRYKLLALTLFPILLVMPVALLAALYWGSNFSYQQLFMKVTTDLSVAHDVFRRIRQDYLGELARLGESYAFRTTLEAGRLEALRAQLQALRDTAGFSFLNLVDGNGRILYSSQQERKGSARHSSALEAALDGEARVGVEIFSHHDLERESPELAEKVRMPLLETPRARPSDRKEEDRGMVIRALYPVRNNRGRVIGVLDGGVLLNGNFAFVDTIRDLVYGPGSLPEGSIGTVTVFLDDVRISTNVPLGPGERALGTRVSNEVRTRVLDQGKIWIDRAFVVNDWYISSYEPILDVDGNRVGMLYAGFLEAPFRHALWQAFVVLVLFFLALMALTAVISIQGAKSIFRPLEMMSAVVRSVRSGRPIRMPQVEATDEIGELAREFDAMLVLLQERNRQISEWAERLEDKVQERTAELEKKNQELQQTIRLLRETRQQLVVAEKLAALGELTAGVAHEINNPTAVMLGNLDLLVEELGEAARPVQAEIDLIIEQIYRIKKIIDGLLQYARQDQYSGEAERIDVNEIVRRTLPLVRHLRKKRDFEIELKLDTVPLVEFNAHELQQVLVNLVTNAVHALPETGGRIVITTEEWERKGCVIHVQDNGSGIEPGQIDRLFNPFFTTRREGEGTGLGLSVSYGLVRHYGGNITVRSRLGEGSCFSVWLLSEARIVTDEEALAEQLHSMERHGAG
jgi:two-component system NtrC family sensor kinase